MECSEAKGWVKQARLSDSSLWIHQRDALASKVERPDVTQANRAPGSALEQREECEGGLAELPIEFNGGGHAKGAYSLCLLMCAKFRPSPPGPKCLPARSVLERHPNA